MPLTANQSRFSEQHAALIVDQLTATSCKTNERCATTFSSLPASFLRMEQQLCECAHPSTSLFCPISWVSQEDCLMIGTDSHSSVESKQCMGMLMAKHEIGFQFSPSVKRMGWNEENTPFPQGSCIGARVREFRTTPFLTKFDPISALSPFSSRNTLWFYYSRGI